MDKDPVYEENRKYIINKIVVLISIVIIVIIVFNFFYYDAKNFISRLLYLIDI